MSRRSLKQYAEKRDFKRTPEPAGSRGASSQRPLFVIQKHDATTLHYDFRLEIDGVLVSWVLPVGPSTDPREKRLAIRTEDHPLDYARFEGVIPEGQYGAGAVIVWDTGTYRVLPGDGKANPPDAGRALDAGHLEIWIEGEKLRGGYALIHAKVGGDEKNWLLVKMRDAQADARRNPVSTEPNSVLSGRSIEEVAEAGSA